MLQKLLCKSVMTIHQRIFNEIIEYKMLISVLMKCELISANLPERLLQLSLTYWLVQVWVTISDIASSVVKSVKNVRTFKLELKAISIMFLLNNEHISHKKCYSCFHTTCTFKKYTHKTWPHSWVSLLPLVV